VGELAEDCAAVELAGSIAPARRAAEEVARNWRQVMQESRAACEECFGCMEEKHGNLRIFPKQAASGWSGIDGQ